MSLGGISNYGKEVEQKDPNFDRALESIVSIEEQGAGETKNGDGRLAAIRRKTHKTETSSGKGQAIDALDQRQEAVDIYKEFASKKTERAEKKIGKEMLSTRKEDLAAFAKELQPAVIATVSDRVVLSSLSKDRLKGKLDTTQQSETEFRVRRDESPAQEDKLKELKKAVKEQGLAQAQEGAKALREIPKDIVGSYVSAVAENLIAPTPKKKEELRQIQAQVEAGILSSKEIKTVQEQVKKMLTEDMTKTLRRQYARVAVATAEKSKNLAGFLKEVEGYDSVLTNAIVLGLIEEGPVGRKTLQEDINNEYRFFVADELDRTLSESLTKSASIKDLSKAFDKLNGLSMMVEFQSPAYIQTVQKKIENLGLNFFVNPNPNQGSLDDDPKRKKKQTQTQEIEGVSGVESVEDTLRALYEKLHVGVGFVEGLKTKWAIKKAEKKLKESGKEKMLKQLKQESSGFAKLRLMLKLRALFEERATLLEFKGPDYKRIKKEIKKTLKALKDIGCIVEKSDIMNLRDQCNKAIFGVMKEEFIKLEIEVTRNPKHIGLKQKHGNYLIVLNRLKAETPMLEEIKPSMMKGLEFLTDVNIIEAA